MAGDSASVAAKADAAGLIAGQRADVDASVRYFTGKDEYLGYDQVLERLTLTPKGRSLPLILPSHDQAFSRLRGYGQGRARHSLPGGPAPPLAAHGVEEQHQRSWAGHRC